MKIKIKVVHTCLYSVYLPNTVAKRKYFDVFREYLEVKWQFVAEILTIYEKYKKNIGNTADIRSNSL